MDRRKLKKGPSLLGRNGNSFDDLNDNSDVEKTKKPSRITSKTRPKSQQEISREVSPVSFISKTKAKGKILTNTQLSPSKNLANITTRKRLATPSPDRQIFSEDSDENETFITKSKQKTLSKGSQSAKKSTPAKRSSESKRKRLISSSSESDAPQPSISKSGMRGKNNTSTRQTSTAKDSPIKLSDRGNGSQSKNSRQSSVTDYSASREASSAEEEETEDEEDFEPIAVSQKRTSETRNKSFEKNVTPKKRKTNSGGAVGKKKTGEEEARSTDDDMFGEVSPVKEPRNGVESSPTKWQSTGSSSKKKTKNKNVVGQQKSPEVVKHTSRMTRSQSAKKSPIGKNATYNLKKFLKSGGIILTDDDDGPNLLCKT